MPALRKLWDEKPLILILFSAAFFRLLAVFFSKGYGMHDDHFLVIEAAQSWVDGQDYNDWLPTITKTVTEPTGHSLLYPGAHYLLFHFLQFLGIHDPQGKMIVVRFLHAAWSMLVVYFGFRIAEKSAGLKAARMTGLLLAVLFFMPMMSVRNLVEFVCIPPLMYATWLIWKQQGNVKSKYVFFTGMLLGLACSIRFQTIFFSAGFGLVFLLQKKIKEAILVAAGFFACLFLLQAITDMIVWHKPFMELTQYIRYNLDNAETYGTQKWYNYILLVSGILVPPFSVFMFWGYLRSWRKYLLLFLPAFVFFVFHSSFPNKQERFILPFIPFFITLGCIGWEEFRSKSTFWNSHHSLYRSCWIFFFSINTIPLFFISCAYSHRNRVESMVYLSGKKDFRNFIVEESMSEDYTMPPQYYLGHWVKHLYVTKIITGDSLVERLEHFPESLQPNYVVFNRPENIGQRILNMKKYYPSLTYETTIEPGLVDVVMHRLNKHNANFTSYIYRVNELHPVAAARQDSLSQ